MRRHLADGESLIARHGAHRRDALVQNSHLPRETEKKHGETQRKEELQDDDVGKCCLHAGPSARLSSRSRGLEILGEGRGGRPQDHVEYRIKKAQGRHDGNGRRDVEGAEIARSRRARAELSASSARPTFRATIHAEIP